MARSEETGLYPYAGDMREMKAKPAVMSINDELIALRETIGLVDAEISQLNGRLECVLTPLDSPLSVSDQSSNTHGSELVNKVRDLRLWVERIRTDVSRLNQRIEL